MTARREYSATFAEGEAVALPSVLLSTTYSGMRLRYWAKQYGREAYLDEVVPFTRTPMQSGGQRQSLECLGCGRRVRVLYGGKRNLFRCRKCYGLVYRSTRQTWSDRADSQADKLALKICGGDREIYDGDEFPEKPKRMRWETYRQLEERFYDLKDMCAAGMMANIMRFSPDPDLAAMWRPYRRR